MAYTIRYGLDRAVRRESGPLLRYRVIVALGLLALTAALRIFWDGGAALAAEILAAPPETVTELAVAALADSVAAGKGWYYGLAVWCRTILDAGAA